MSILKVGMYASQFPVGDRDPHWDNVVVLMHFDGDLTDEKGNTWGALPTGWSFINSDFSGKKLKKAQGINSHISSDLYLGFGANEDFTIEFRYSGLGTGVVYDWFISSRGLAVNTSGLRISYYYRNDRRHLAISFNTAAVICDIYPPPQNAHIAFVRKNGATHVFVDGISQAVQDPNGLNGIALSNTSPLSFGALDNNVNTRESFELEELRITKGVARYTENFTPPTEPFPSR